MPRSIASQYSDSSSVKRLRGFKLPQYARAPVHYHEPPRRHVIGLTHNYDIDEFAGAHVPCQTVHQPAHYAPASREMIPHHHHHHRHMDSLRPQDFVDVEEHEREELVPIKVRERQVNRTREVPVPYPVPHMVEVPKPYPVEKIVQVPKIIEKLVEVPVEVERPVEVPIPYPVEVIRTIEVPVPVERTTEKIVHVDRPIPASYRVEVPVHHERIKEVQVPVVEQVAVPMADPRLHKVIRELQDELRAAYCEIDRSKGYGGRYAAAYAEPDRVPTRRIAEPGIHVADGPLRPSRQRLLAAPVEHHPRARQEAFETLANQHPTRKWGGLHDIPGKPSYPNETYYKRHGQPVHAFA